MEKLNCCKKITDNKYYLYIKLTPNAKSDKIDGIFCNEEGQEYLKVSTTAVPEDNKANKQLIKILAKKYNMKKSDIVLLKGFKSRLKILELKKNVFE